MLRRKGVSILLVLCLMAAMFISAGMTASADGPQNLAIDDVWASESHEGTNIHGIPTSVNFLIDGVTESGMYISRTEMAGGDLNVDMVFYYDAGADISRVIMHRGEYTAPTDFKIYASQDGGDTWLSTPLHEEIGYAGAFPFDVTFPAVTANAIKINVTATSIWYNDAAGWAPCSFVNLREVQIFGEAPTDPLVHRTWKIPYTATASSTFEGVTEFDAIPTGLQYLNDGNLDAGSGMYYSSAESQSPYTINEKQQDDLTNPVEIITHLDTAAYVSKVTLVQGRSYPASFTVYTSADSGVTWEEADSMENVTFTGSKYTSAFDARLANAVKIKVTSVFGWGTDFGYGNFYYHFVGLAELEVYGVAIPNAPEVAIESVFAPSFNGGVDGGNENIIPTGIEFLTDGDPNPGNGMYYNRAPDAGSALNDVSVNIILKLGSNVDVSKIALYQGRSHPKTFSIYTSVDEGLTWSAEPVYQATDSAWTGTSCAIAIDNVPANAIKINVTSVSGWDNWFAFIYFLSLAEIDVFGSPSSALFPQPDFDGAAETALGTLLKKPDMPDMVDINGDAVIDILDFLILKQYALQQQ